MDELVVDELVEMIERLKARIATLESGIQKPVAINSAFDVVSELPTEAPVGKSYLVKGSNTVYVRDVSGWVTL